MKRLFTSCFGLGFLPVAPGTWGSGPTVVIFVLLSMAGLDSLWMSLAMAVLILAGSFVCVKFGPAVMEQLGKKDPGEIVADEFAGQAVVFLGIGTLASRQALIVGIAGFVLFRIFDILKPWPIKKLEKLPDGWGVLADDLMAGVYAGVVLQIIFRLRMAA